MNATRRWRRHDNFEFDFFFCCDCSLASSFACETFFFFCLYIYIYSSLVCCFALFVFSHKTPTNNCLSMRIPNTRIHRHQFMYCVFETPSSSRPYIIHFILLCVCVRACGVWICLWCSLTELTSHNAAKFLILKEFESIECAARIGIIQNVGYLKLWMFTARSELEFWNRSLDQQPILIWFFFLCYFYAGTMIHLLSWPFRWRIEIQSLIW